jgi:ferredoxin/flavodoxin---NADP+ reductase
MFEIVEKRTLAPAVILMRVKAPEIAVKRKPGQFVILRLHEEGERFPLTIVDSDATAGTITIILQTVGGSTRTLGAMEVGQSVLDVVGPLGNPTHVENFGRVVCIGGGLGIALAYPITKAFKLAGNHVTSLISGRNSELVILEDEMRAVSDVLVVATDDGSKGFKGFPTQILQQMMDRGDRIDLVLAVGPVPMMRAVARVTQPKGIHTVVSLNPIMVDGTGMCGGCRVTVGGQTRFACVDGPEFDGHQVDFNELMKRLKAYSDYEKVTQADHACRLQEAAK